jgi:hypothetical protein
VVSDQDWAKAQPARNSANLTITSPFFSSSLALFHTTSGLHFIDAGYARRYASLESGRLVWLRGTRVALIHMLEHRRAFLVVKLRRVGARQAVSSVSSMVSFSCERAADFCRQFSTSRP